VSTRTDAEVAAPIQGGRSRSTLRTVAVPSEHGGWSLTAEPVLLGLVVAWSWAGLALGLAAVLAFVARTPLKVLLVDRWRRRWLDRSRMAARVVAVEVAALLVLVVLAARAGAASFWVPLALAAPLVAVELWFDMRSRSRRMIPELAGTIGMGSVAAAIALAGGADAALAAGLWCVIAARSAAAIPYVRTQLARGRAQAVRLWHSDLAQLLALLSVLVAWVADALPVGPVVVIAAAGALNAVAVRLPPSRAGVIGIQQTFVGLAVVGVTAATVLAM
jgi:hypothetical protein